MFSVFMYTFLGIFIATALLTILSLPGWIKLPSEFRRKLFYSLLLEVVGCVIGFVWVGIKLERTAKPMAITEETLLGGGKWYWQYTPRNWMTEATFSRHNDGIHFNAITYYKRQDGPKLINVPIFVWRSREPINIPLGTNELRIKCVKTVKPEAQSVYGGDAPDAGDCEVLLTLRPEFAMDGVWLDILPNNPSSGGIVLIRSQ